MAAVGGCDVALTAEVGEVVSVSGGGFVQCRLINAPFTEHRFIERIVGVFLIAATHDYHEL